MADFNPKGNVVDIEQKLCQVQGVKAARVVVNETNGIEEIHLIALPSKNPSQLVREVESKLLLECSLPIDRDKVTIAEVKKDLAGKKAGEVQPKVRLKLVDVQITRSNVNATAMVMLQVNDLTLCGESGGPATKHNCLRIVAEACIAALKRVIKSTYAIALDDLRIIELNGDNIAVVKLGQVGESGESQLAGSAIVEKGVEMAIAKAVLDAVNRQLHDVRIV